MKRRSVITLLATGIPDGMVQHQIAGNWVRGLKISPKESWRSELPTVDRTPDRAALLRRGGEVIDSSTSPLPSWERAERS